MATGRQSEQTARLSAAIYPAMVERVANEHGVTVESVYERMGLTGIVGPLTPVTEPGAEVEVLAQEPTLSATQDFGDLELTEEGVDAEGEAEPVTIIRPAQRVFDQTVKRRSVVEQIGRCLSG